VPLRGPHSVTVPGAVEAWFTLLARFGTRTFAELAPTPLRYARHGFPLTTYGRGAVRGFRTIATEDWAMEWRRIYADAGDTLVQPDLARTIETLCNDGPDAYYRGPIASAIAGTLQGFGALMTTDDLSAHAGNWTEPIS